MGLIISLERKAAFNWPPTLKWNGHPGWKLGQDPRPPSCPCLLYSPDLIKSRLFISQTCNANNCFLLMLMFSRENSLGLRFDGGNTDWEILTSDLEWIVAQGQIIVNGRTFLCAVLSLMWEYLTWLCHCFFFLRTQLTLWPFCTKNSIFEQTLRYVQPPRVGGLG